MTLAREKKILGRPFAFTIDELRARIKDFWVYVGTHDVYPTKSRLAAFLGVSRQTLTNYQFGDIYEEGFNEAINEVNREIEARMEEALYEADRKNVNGVKFSAVNNWGWADKTEIASNSEVHLVVDKDDMEV